MTGRVTMATQEGAVRKTAVGPVGLGRAGGLICILFAYANSGAFFIPSRSDGSAAPHHVGPAPQGLRHPKGWQNHLGHVGLGPRPRSPPKTLQLLLR